MSDRDSRGRFVKGNQVAKNNSGGRPRRKVEENYLTLTVEGVSPTKWGQVVAKALKQAVAGDPRARQWLGDILIGKYVQADISGSYTEAAFAEVLALMDPLIADEHREAYEESLKALSERMEER